MKTFYPKLTAISIAVIALCTLLFYACRRAVDAYPSNISTDTTFNVVAAKKYYNEFIKTAGRVVPSKFAWDNQNARTVNDTSNANKKYVMWKKGYASSTDKFSFVEAPLNYNQKVSSFIKKEGEDVNAETEQKILAASLTRIVVFKDNHTQALSQYIVNYIPDSVYLKNHNYDISNNQVNKIDKDFSGFIKYTTWDGEPKALFKIRNGKATSRGKYKKEIINGAHGKNERRMSSSSSAFEVCDTYYDEIEVPDCFDSDPESPGGSSGVTCTVYHIPVSYIVCYNDGNDGGDGDDDPCLDPSNFYLPQCNGYDPGGDNSGCRCSEPPAPPDPSTDPCQEKKFLNALVKNAIIAAQNKAMADLLNTSNLEWGTEEVLKDWNHPDEYKSKALRHGATNGTEVAGDFSWNARDGYTIGFTHSHPNGTGPSPDDIFELIENLVEYDLVQSGSGGVTFYKNNARITIITTDNTYVLSVKDWEGLYNLYNNNWKNHEQEFRDEIVTLNESYYHSYEKALLSKFGNLVNLFTSLDPGGKDFIPIRKNQNDQIEAVPCN